MNIKPALQLLFILMLNPLLLIAGTPGYHHIGKCASKGLHIRVYYNKAKINDTLRLSFYENMLTRFPTPGMDRIIYVDAAMRKDSCFHFDFCPKVAMGYITIERKLRKEDTQSNYRLLESYPVENGDDFTIDMKYQRPKNTRDSFITPDKIRHGFSGLSGWKYKLLDHVDSAAYQVVQTTSLHDNGKQISFSFLTVMPPSERLAIKRLDSIKSLFDKSFYEHLMADIFYKYKWQLYSNIPGFYSSWVSKQDSEVVRRFKEQYLHLKNKELLIPATILFQSNYYADAELAKLRADDVIKYGRLNVDHLPALIRKNYSGILREKLLIAFLQTYQSELTDFAAYIKSASGYINSNYGKQKLKILYKWTAGNLAANFYLPNYQGRNIRFSDFKGKVVFIDFWFTGCGNCVRFYQNELSKTEQYFLKDSAVVFISISIDKNSEKWKKSVESNLYTSLRSVNLYTGGRGQDDPLIKQYGINTFPHPILINKNGRIVNFGNSSLSKDATLTHEIEKLLH